MNGEEFEIMKIIKSAALIGAVIGLGVAFPTQAATLSWSATAPTVDGADIANFTGVWSDANNINGGDDEQTYIAGGRPEQGQTFTTGSNGGQGFTLTSITLQQVHYASDSTWWSVDSGWGSGNPFYIRIGTISAGTFTAVSTETAQMVVSGIPALDASGTQNGNGLGAYFTATLDTPVWLADNTTYAFTIDSFGPFIELNGSGITDNNYTGGKAFTVPQGSASAVATILTGDRVFHLGMVAGGVIPSSPATRPATAPVATVDLSGTWKFTPLGQSQTNIQVPGGGWYKQGFTSIGEADYETSMTITNIGRPQVTWLEFGAVNYQADLYINNTLVGSRTQSFTPASFDITDYVMPGNTCNIRVHVKGRNAFMSGGKSLVPNAAGWSPNTPQGIFRSAELKVYPAVYISDVFVRTSVQSSNLFYDVTLRNESATATNVTLSGNLAAWNGAAWSYPSLPSRIVSLAAGAETNITVGPVYWDLSASSYWWPNVPYQPGYQAQLHNLNLSLTPAGGGALIYTNSTRFGFRELVQRSDGTNTCYFLNGIRVNFRGDNIQGADYDSIIYGGGRGDAFDTLPGFLPGVNGWPEAVDNYQRLNYNFVRLHQEPVTPYMIDVCDEMGLMLMEETAIRGSANDQDFINGHDNMVNHLKALFARDRHHPSIVRQSLSNEPNQSSTDSTQFEIDLYNAAMSVDGTRPLSIDAGTPANTYETMTYTNFSVYRHYGTGSQFGQYVENVFVRTDRPYGEGEFIWSADNTRQGFCWFATAAQAMRAQGASDVRPYTLLSAWASFVPGVNRIDMTLEQGGNPLYGADTLPSAWTNNQIQRVQAGFNPVLVADTNYWDAAKLSNANGDWPANIPFITPGQSLTRTLTIYNDTFSGTDVDVFWEFRQNSATGPIVASGVVNATVPLGYTQYRNIMFTAPHAANGTIFYLVLYTRKNGAELFRESSQQFLMFSQTKLSGTAFGASPPYAAGREYYRATDDDITTFYDYTNANGSYTGIDLGQNNSNRISFIVFTPRAGFESRMNGGVFQGSMDGINYTAIYTISGTPSGTTSVLVNTAQAYRYLKYAGPNGSYGNIAEMTFYAPNAGTVPTTPTNLMWSVSGTNLNLSWPAGYTGWWLQVQTNALNAGLGTNWMYLPGSSLTNKQIIPVDFTKGGVFYRMAY